MLKIISSVHLGHSLVLALDDNTSLFGLFRYYVVGSNSNTRMSNLSPRSETMSDIKKTFD